MSKKAYIYFSPEELNKRFEEALVEIRKKVAIYQKKKNLENLFKQPSK
jgi:hypothetical protein